MTTVENIRKRLRITDTRDDEFLAQTIRLCTGVFEQRCNRTFRWAANAQYEFDPGTRTVLLWRFPIHTISLWERCQGSIWEAAEMPEVSVDASAGIVCLPEPIGGSRARITYTGGYLFPGDSQLTPATAADLPADLRAACEEQVAKWYQDRDCKGRSSMSAGGGSISLRQETLLPEVELVLRRYTRIVLI